MKLRYAKGCSISIWDEEFEDLQISDSFILYRTLQGRQIRIQVPASWTKLTQDANIEDKDQDELKGVKKSKNGDVQGPESCVRQKKLNEPPCIKDQMDKEIENLKRMLEVLRSNLRKDVQKAEEDLGRLYRNQEKDRKENHLDFGKMKEVVDEIWEELDNFRGWRLLIEEVVGINEDRGPPANYNPRQAKRGRNKSSNLQIVCKYLMYSFVNLG